MRQSSKVHVPIQQLNTAKPEFVIVHNEHGAPIRFEVVAKEKPDEAKSSA